MFVSLSPIDSDEEFHASSVFWTCANARDFQGGFETINPRIVMLATGIVRFIVDGRIDTGVKICDLDG